MERLKRLLIVLSVFIVLSLIVSGCNQSEKDDGKEVSKSGGDFNFFLFEPAAIDPLNVQESEGFQVATQLFDGLVTYDPKTMEVKPAVAKSWESNDEATVFTFNLRDDSKFQNGKKVTAQSFKDAWTRVADPNNESPTAYHLAPIKGFNELQSGDSTDLVGVKAIDDETLEVTIERPFSEFPTILGHPVFSPVDIEEVDKDPAAFAEKPVGNGPFKMAEPWDHGKGISLEKFSDYYGEEPFLDTVDFKIFADLDTGFLEFKSGSLDSVPIPLGQVGATKEEFGDKAIVGDPQQSLDFIGFNLNSSPFKDNPDLRKAIGEALDKDGMAKAIYEGTRVPTDRILPPSLSGEKDEGDHGADVEKAEDLLKDAGFPEGKGLSTIKLSYIAGESDQDELAQAIQSDLGKVGIKVEIEGMEAGAFFDALFAGKLQMYLLNWTADYPTPDSFLYSLFHSESENNIAGYQNDDFDELLSSARETTDTKERKELHNEADEKIIKDSVIIPEFFQGSASLIAKDVEGYKLNAQNIVELKDVWFKK